MRFTRAAFGLKNVSAVFQNTMVEVFKNIPNVLIYLEDIIVVAKDGKDFLNCPSLILDRCVQRRVKLGKKKCTFLTKDSEIKILGSIFQRGTRRIDEDRIDAILSVPIPENIHELRSFIGSINYIRDWLPNISCLLKPLTELLQKVEGKPESQSPQKIMKSLVRKRWTPKHTKCFKAIKELIANSISLELPQPNEALIISTDASKYAVSVCPQLPRPQARPCVFLLQNAHRQPKSWPIIQKELYAIVATLTQPNLSYLLLNRRLKLYCDHKNLAYLLTSPEKSRIVKRWLPTLRALDFEVFHVDAESNLFADMLSRLTPKEKREVDLTKSAINGRPKVPCLAISPARRAKLRAVELAIKSCQPRADSEGEGDTVRITKLTPAIFEENQFLPCLIKGCSGVVIDYWLSSDLYLFCCEQCSTCMSPMVYNDAALLLKTDDEPLVQRLDRRSL
ncbi:hypothetical protein GEMRC1_011200 [Eukaryota sp. GEM-RC1]